MTLPNPVSYSANEQASAFTTKGPQLRVIPETVMPKSFALGTGNIAVLTPLVYNKATDRWQVWHVRTWQVTDVVKSGTVSGGTYTLAINNKVTTAIAYNANAATVQAALLALGDMHTGDVVVTGGPLNSAALTLTFGGNLDRQDVIVAINPASLTGGGSAAIVDPGSGASVAALKVTNVAGFVWPEDVVLAAANDVIGNVLMEATLHFDDIVLPAGETSDNLKLALIDGVRQRDFIIQGLPHFH